MEELRKQFEEETGITATFIFDGEKCYRPLYVKWLEQRLERKNPLETIIMPDSKCGCGKPVRYMTKDSEMACNKYGRCMTYEELSKHRFWLTQLLEAYRNKRKVDGLNGRGYNALEHFRAEGEIIALEKTAEKLMV